MVQSGDPKPEDTLPEQASDHDDDLIGFASPRALEGRPWATSVTPFTAGVEAGPATESSAPPAPFEDADLFDPAPVIRPRWGAEPPIVAEAAPVLVEAPEPEPIAPAAPEPIHAAPVLSVVEPEPVPEPEPVRASPAWMDRAVGPRPMAEPGPVPAARAVADPRLDFETPPVPAAVPPRWSPAEARRSPARAAAEGIEGQAGLFTLYALILLIVPTLGVAGAIALFAVLGRSAPSQPEALSHHVFQKRTLIIAAGVAVAGVFLMAAPFALGVISLFGVAVWVIVRGAWGLWRLKAGLPISNPRGLWI